ncbi:MAG: hypothetical protein QM754_18600 [Tepidisphaeraceae bacterium]
MPSAPFWCCCPSACLCASLVKLTTSDIVTGHYSDDDGAGYSALTEEPIGDFLNGDYYVPKDIDGILPDPLEKNCGWYRRVENYGPVKLNSTLDDGWCSRWLTIQIVPTVGGGYRITITLGYSDGIHSSAVVFDGTGSPVDGVVTFTNDIPGPSESDPGYLPPFYAGTITMECADGEEDAGFPGGTIDDECIDGPSAYYHMDACSEDGLSNVYISKADREAFASKSTEPYDGKCYIVDDTTEIAESDLPDPAIILDKLSFTGCADCGCGGCGANKLKMGTEIAGVVRMYFGNPPGTPAGTGWNGGNGGGVPPGDPPSTTIDVLWKLVDRPPGQLIFEGISSAAVEGDPFRVTIDCGAEEPTAVLTFGGVLRHDTGTGTPYLNGNFVFTIEDLPVTFDNPTLTVEVPGLAGVITYPAIADGYDVVLYMNEWSFNLYDPDAFCEE